MSQIGIQSERVRHPQAAPDGEDRVPGTWSAVQTLAAVTLRRLGRGKALWIGVGIAALPLVNATIVHANAEQFKARPSEMFAVSLAVLALLPGMFIGASIAEEIEERTTTYLWSRPLARWTVLAGKLLALAPLVVALAVGGWIASHQIWLEALPPLRSCLALAAGGVAISLVAAGMATIVPKHGMAFTIAYVLIDLFVGALPFSLSELSIGHQVMVLSQLTGDPPDTLAPALTMLVLAGVWSAIGVVRIQRLEA